MRLPTLSFISAMGAMAIPASAAPVVPGPLKSPIIMKVADGCGLGFHRYRGSAYRTASTAPIATFDRTIGQRPYRCHCHRTYQHRDIRIREVDTEPTSIITDTDPCFV